MNVLIKNVFLWFIVVYKHVWCDILINCLDNIYPESGDIVICPDGCDYCNIFCVNDYQCQNGIIVYSAAMFTYIHCNGLHSCQGSQFYFGTAKIPDGYHELLFDKLIYSVDIDCYGDAACMNTLIDINANCINGLSINGNSNDDYLGNIESAIISCELTNNQPCILNCGDCGNTLFKCEPNTDCVCNGNGCNDLAFLSPTAVPTLNPTVITTLDPSLIQKPTETPTVIPTRIPSTFPTFNRSKTTTLMPTITLTIDPSKTPTTEPTSEPTTEPTNEPTTEPTIEPTLFPTINPSTNPTQTPSVYSTKTLTNSPTNILSISPTMMPILKINAPIEAFDFQAQWIITGAIISLVLIGCGLLITAYYWRTNKKRSEFPLSKSEVHAPQEIITRIIRKNPPNSEGKPHIQIKNDFIIAQEYQENQFDIKNITLGNIQLNDIETKKGVIKSNIQIMNDRIIAMEAQRNDKDLNELTNGSIPVKNWNTHK